MRLHEATAWVRLFVIALALPLAAAAAETPQKARPESLQRWREARFGMFIHWGPVSLKETEISWSRANSNPQCPNNGPIPVAVYDNLYREFNPAGFQAKEWVALAKEAGMKYMVLTAKHCDGFLLWDSKVDAYNIMSTPFKRDVCGELAGAAHEAGMAIGWYFSPMDWRDPDCRGPKNGEFVKRMQAELTELLSRYGKIDILWFDWDARPAVWDQATTYPLVRRLQPQVVISDRLDKPGAGLIGPWADFYTPEQQVGGFDDQNPWESCMTISRRNQWSWGGPKDGVKTYEECMNMLIRCAGGDGNLLLNVGPRPDGVIDPEQAGRLREMGAWLAKYGESIYGTRGGPFRPGGLGVSTRKDRTIYLHVQRRSGGTLALPPLPAKVLRARALTGGEVTFAQSGDGIEVVLPAEARPEVDTVVALELDGPAGSIPVLPPFTAERSLCAGRKATASNVYHGEAQYGPDKAADGNSETRWATDGGTTSAWLEVDLGKPVTFGRAGIVQAYPELKRVRKFQVEYWQDGSWKSCYSGENPGPTLEAAFEPVTAQRARLNITEATDGPTLWEFELFPPKK